MSESTLSPELERERAIVRAYLKDGLKIGEIVQRFNLTGPNAVYAILRKADAPRFEQARAGKAELAAAAATAPPSPEPVPIADPVEILAVEANGNIELVKVPAAPLETATPAAPTEKACTQCGKTKPLDDFHRMASMPDGRRPSCKVCDAEKQKIRDAKKAEPVVKSTPNTVGLLIEPDPPITTELPVEIEQEPAVTTQSTQNGHLDTTMAKLGHLKVYHGTRKVVIVQRFELMAPDFLAAARLAEDSVSPNVDTNDIDSIQVTGLSTEQ